MFPTFSRRAILRVTAVTMGVIFVAAYASYGQSAGAAMSGGSGAGTQNPLVQLNRLQREIDRTSPTNRSGLDKLTIPPQLLYYAGGWTAGTVSPTASAPALPEQAMRYNVVLQRLEIQDAHQTTGFRVLTPDALSGFTVVGPDHYTHQFATKPYSDTGRPRQQAFFEVLVSGTVELLVLHEFYIQPAEFIATYNIESKPEEYRRITRLFAGGSAKEAVYELTLTKAAVLKLFDKETRAEITAYATANHLTYTDVNDVVKLVTYYNSSHPVNSKP
ncbi:hypothetical protein [Hymenobacter metallilatus]|uniref:Uncharacterized protein n=1 Tax=Hymenobacter metallilatus TaxID=2493666 RepID=A0A3R9UPT4_9BACT|nr:hypothetical protein [Hymenobacter metallilatus]RSK37424.1 hypothetical protein EI290_01880 [Hymenobacter metallilatus]